MEFKHFLGNEKIKAQLSALVDGGRLPHAVVLEGESGLGKRTLAGELAAALVCRGEHRPCDSCPQCHKARAGVHPDILVYAPEGGARSFHKKTVDQIVGDVYMTPNEADYKIYILVNAHLMTELAERQIMLGMVLGATIGDLISDRFVILILYSYTEVTSCLECHLLVI